MTEPTLSIGEVARMAGVTVRTLHHYDRIGLLRPARRAVAGYRRYAHADLERLQQVLFYRELEFSLDDIARLLAADADALSHLRRQRELLGTRIVRLQHLSAAVEAAMEAHRMKIRLTPEEQLEVFGAFRPEAHAPEAEDRWGASDAWREAARRTSGYTRPDWDRLNAQGQAAIEAVVAAMLAAEPATSGAAMDAAEAHRRHIDEAFYPCPHELHRQLAAGYLADPRFTATYEAVAPGLTQYLHDAIVANTARQDA